MFSNSKIFTGLQASICIISVGRFAEIYCKWALWRCRHTSRKMSITQTHTSLGNFLYFCCDCCFQFTTRLRVVVVQRVHYPWQIPIDENPRVKSVNAVSTQTSRFLLIRLSQDVWMFAGARLAETTVHLCLSLSHVCDAKNFHHCHTTRFKNSR